MLKLLEMSKIVNGKNIRNEHDDEIAELAESIEKQGLINPILVQKRDDGKYVVIAGHRRYEAVKRLGLPHIECNVFEDMNEKDIILAQIAENVQRKNMSAYELVETFEYMKNKLHMNQNAIARRFGKSDVWVTNQYQAVQMLEAEYGKKIPASAKKKTAGQVKHEAAKHTRTQELIVCEGMKVKVVGHTYTLFVGDNATENDLREFINARKAY